ncbi:MAG TPA: KpsF/GutQ family sugar-phosphate isomerase [Candidatus Latescibacteria bacterium]|nr:KpsF/GutQ family sugar-phosphate isomerase [Candidatus Latescibacterota bacterium]
MSIEEAKRVIALEAEAVASLIDRIDQNFERAVDIIYQSRGRVVVTGMGKSGIIGKKIAATLSSTGTPAFYLHPAEGIHGDLGVVRRDDVVIAISKSGHTDELHLLMPLFKKLGLPIIAMTGNSKSWLAQKSDVVLDISVEREACPYNLIPTSSTTVTLVLGDALAMALLRRRGFSEEDFALLHPGGSIGRRLIWRVEDLMHTGEEVPVVTESTNMKDVLIEMTSKQLGMTCIIDSNGRLTGVLTDGDLRRLLERVSDPLSINAREAFEKSPRGERRKPPITIVGDELAAKAVKIMDEHIITALVIVDERERPVGVIRWIDLLRAGVI